jgi:IPT/TIG domain
MSPTKRSSSSKTGAPTGKAANHPGGEPVSRPGPGQLRTRVREDAAKRRSDPQGNVRADLWREGIAHAQAMRTWTEPSNGRGAVSAMATSVSAQTATAVLERPVLAPVAGAVPATGAWTQVGPAPLIIDGVQQFMGVGPVAGQVTGIAIDPSGSEDQTIYITSNDGGVWKSTDGGTTWTPKTDTMPTLSMGAIVIDPGNSNVIYAGTGNFFGNQFRKGLGIYRSVDGGDNWGANAPNFNDGNAINPGGIFTGHFNKKIVMPAANLLLVATDAGLFRSIDGGAHFGANAPTFDDGNAIPIAGISTGDITDLAIDSVSSTVIYVGVDQQGLFKSTDSGATFPAANKLWPSTPPAGGLGNVFFGQSGPGDGGKTIYVSATSDPGVSASQYLGFFKSTDGGATFAPVAGTNAANKANEASLLSNPPGTPQVGYDHVVAVDPNAPNLVYLCFQEVYVSTDGGVSFGVPPTPNKMTGNSDAQTHWDHHVVVFSPPSHVNSSPTRVYAGNDGGLVRSDDGGNTWTNLNAGVATCLFLGIDIGRGSAANNVWTYGGCQDNGTIEHRNDSSGTEWHLMFNGDGGKIAVDPNDPTKAYGNSNGDFILTTDGGLHWDSSGHGIPFGGAVCAAVDPNASANVYVGFSGLAGPPPVPPQLFFSNNSGSTFTSLTNLGAAPTSIAIAPTNSQTIYVSLADGTIQKSTDGGTTWNPTGATGAPANMIAEQVTVDPTDATQVAVVYSGFSGIDPAANPTKHVFLSNDGGGTWTDVSGTAGGPALQNLSDLPLYSVVFDPDTSPNHAIIVAGDGGVMWSLDKGATWQRLGTQLPNAECRSLALDRTASPSLLRVGTFGRSVFELAGKAPPVITAVSPSSGAAAGGDSVTITGTGFTGATAVNFGGSAASSVNVLSDTQITCTSPAGNGNGTVDVTVTTPAGTSATSAADQFTYTAPNAPAVTGVSPSTGAAAGGDSVTITGTGFTGATGVSFGANAATGVSVMSDTQITCISPAGSGTVDVTVTIPAGTSATSAADQFTYAAPPAPVVTGVAPSTGAAAGGDAITITGTGFTGATVVSFGGTGASAVNVMSDTQITCTSPAGNGTVDVTVTTPAGTSTVGPADQFTYAAVAPVVSGVQPNNGTAGGGDSVTIMGTGFTGAISVSFGANVATGVSVDSDTQISCTSASGAGTVDVTVTTPAGTSATGGADQFTYN